MMKSIKKLAAALGLVAVAATAQAASVPLLGTYNLNGATNIDIVTVASNRNTDGTANNQPYQSNYFYQLLVGAYDLATTFSLTATTNETVPVRYFLWADLDSSTTSSSIANLLTGPGGNGSQGELLETVPYLNVNGSFQYTLAANTQYVLQVQKTQQGWESISTEISAVPLPGAALLFGTALAGFFGFSNRRKV